MAAWPERHDGNLAFFILAATTLVSTRFRLGPIALVVLLGVGIELRFTEFATGASDVLQVVRAGIDEALRGANPYAPDPGVGRAPFPYGPIALIWYLPWRDPRIVEFGISIATLFVLAVRGRPMGLALWAVAPFLVSLASDGSNDHTAALLLLVSLLVLERMPRAGALLIGVSAGFKIYALAWLPPVFFWAGAGAFAAGLVGAAAMWLPTALIFGPSNVLATFRAAEAVHAAPYYSVGEMLARLGIGVAREALDLFRLVAGAATAAVVSPLARSFAGVVVAGMAIYFVTLYAGFWSTSAYLVPLALVVCWFIDVWLGPQGSRIAWPSDPVARLTEAVDRRWPRVDAARIGHQ